MSAHSPDTDLMSAPSPDSHEMDSRVNRPTCGHTICPYVTLSNQLLTTKTQYIQMDKFILFNIWYYLIITFIVI